MQFLGVPVVTLFIHSLKYRNIPFQLTAAFRKFLKIFSHEILATDLGSAAKVQIPRVCIFVFMTIINQRSHKLFDREIVRAVTLPPKSLVTFKSLKLSNLLSS